MSNGMQDGVREVMKTAASKRLSSSMAIVMAERRHLANNLRKGVEVSGLLKEQ